VFVVDGVDGDHVLEVDQEVPHHLRPAGPANALIHLEGVYEQLSNFSLVGVDQEGNPELL
jgi:hypothetical protein